MNYILLLKAYEQWTETNYLSGNAELLWYKLVSLWNKSGWKEWISVENQKLMSMLRMKNEHSFIRSRQLLVDAGLLEYQRGRKGSPGRYRMITESFAFQADEEISEPNCTDKTPVEKDPWADCTGKMSAKAPDKAETGTYCTDKTSDKRDSGTDCTDKMQAENENPPKCTCILSANGETGAICPYKSSGKTAMTAGKADKSSDIYKQNILSKKEKERENIIRYPDRAPKVSQYLTMEEYDCLVREFGRELVDRKRTKAAIYRGCDSYATLKKWCQEEQQQRRENNRFNNFHQRDYDFAEYERMLLARS